MTSTPTPAPTGSLVRRLDHVAIAVRDLGAASRLFIDLLGGELVAGGDHSGTGLRTMQLRYAAGAKVELLTPLDDDSYLHGYLDKRGEGLHHVTLMVDDVGRAAERLGEAGVQTVDTRTGTGEWDETFVRPSHAFGTLVQLAASPLVWTEPMMPAGATAEDVVAGRLEWKDSRPTWKCERTEDE